MTVWGFHCTRVDLDLVGSGEIAVGWDELGDLSTIPNDQEAFKERIKDTYPDVKTGAIPNWAGQLRRFAHEVGEGDLVVYRETGGGPIHIGRVTGGYFRRPETDFGQRIPVDWSQEEFQATNFPSGALFELGAFLTLFKIKNHADVWLHAFDGLVAAEPSLEPSDDEDLEPEENFLDAEKIDQGTRDYVRKQLSKHFKGHAMAALAAQILGHMGFQTSVSPPGADGGVDIRAHQGPLGIEPPLVKVQVKSSEAGVGSPEISGLLGTLKENEVGLFITLGHFKKPAKDLEQDNPKLRLIDGVEFIDLILKHYEELEPETTAKISLRRVYARDLTG